MSPPRGAEIVIGVDVGTTAVKVAAFAVGRPWRVSVAREYPTRHPEPGASEQDPERVVAATLEALRDVVARLDGRPVRLISLSTAMHALAGLDAAARPLTPVLTWADGRATSVARELRADPVAARLHARTGTPVHAMSPLVKLRWLTGTRPLLARSVVTWVGLKELVLHRLTGQVVTELSSAGGTGLLDLATRRWEAEALEVAGVRLGQLPPVLPTTAVVPLSAEPAAYLGLPAGMPVVAGAGDGPLGNLGTGATDPGVAGLSLGTSGALRLMTSRPYADPHGRLFCYALTEDRWVVGSAVSNGGSVVRWAGSVFLDDDERDGMGAGPDETLLAWADGVPAGSDGLVMLPFLLPERGPAWDGDLRGAYLGLRRDHTRGHLVRAAVEGVALQLAAVLDALESVQPVTSVRATGGAFRSQLWRDIVAAALDRPLLVTEAAEGTALGAVALGLHAVGEVTTPEAGVALVDGSTERDTTPPVVAPPVAVTAYRSLRASVSTLVDQLHGPASLLAPARP